MKLLSQIYLRTKNLSEGSRLSKFDIFMMSFLKVQLNLYDEDIACRFGIYKSIISRVLGILYTHTED